MKIKHLEKYILLLSFIAIVVLFILFSKYSPNSCISFHPQIKTFSLKTKNGKTYFSLNRELSLLPGDFIHLTQDDGKIGLHLKLRLFFYWPVRKFAFPLLRNYKWYNTTRCCFRQKMEKIPRFDFSSQW